MAHLTEDADNIVMKDSEDRQIIRIPRTGLVTPGVVGDSSHIPSITVDSQGRVTAYSQTLAGGGAVALLSTTTLASPGAFDVSGISQAYNDLILVLIVRGTAAATGESIVGRLNTDSGANYYSEDLFANNAAAGGTPNAGSTFGFFGRGAAGSAGAGIFGMGEIVIPGYAVTTWHKQWFSDFSDSESTAAGGQNRYASGGRWASTAAITAVHFEPGTSGSFAAGSQLRIYGRL